MKLARPANQRAAEGEEAGHRPGKDRLFFCFPGNLLSSVSSFFAGESRRLFSVFNKSISSRKTFFDFRREHNSGLFSFSLPR